MSVKTKVSSDLLLEAHDLHSVDTSRAKDGVWLVKVPKYLAEVWNNAGPDGVVGKVVISSSPVLPGQSAGRPGSQVTLVTDPGLLEHGETGKLVPKEHQFLIQTSGGSSASSSSTNSSGSNRPNHVNTSVATPQRRSGAMAGQELIILCEDDMASNSSQTNLNSSQSSAFLTNTVSKSNFSSSRRLSLFGRVNSRAECRPPPNTRYMMLKAQQMKAKNRPKHEVCLLYEPVRNYKPVSNHMNNIEYEARKKAEGKNLRREKEDVMQDLFKAFERHQYYAIKDLVMLTKQPVMYLTEILKEIATFNTHLPHKNMWELKPEYRHYAPPEKPADD